MTLDLGKFVTVIIRQNHNNKNGNVYWGGDLPFPVQTFETHKLTAVTYKGNYV